MKKISLFHSLFSLLALCILVGAVLLSLDFFSPPMPSATNAPATEFSAGRAMNDLEIIAREPHPMGEFPAHAAVRDYLLSNIRDLGLEPQVQDTFGTRFVQPGAILGGVVENILVRMPGREPEGAILLIAHYDSTPGAPGAGDNGSGVAIQLELLRNLHAGSSLRHNVIFLFVDGEEPGLIGSYAFVDQHPWFKEVKLAINMDVGRKGFPGIAQISRGNGLWIQALARTAVKPTYISLPIRLFSSGDQDLVPFKEAGIPGTFFTTATVGQETHTMLDRPETVDPASLQHYGNHILALVRHLGELPTLEMDGEGGDIPPEQLYFPVLGKLIHYPISWAWPLAVMAASFFLGTIVYGFRKKTLTWKGLGMGFLTLLLSMVINLGLISVLWLGIQALHPEYQISPFRPHLSDDDLLLFGFCSLALATSILTISVARKKITALDLAAGSLVFWLAGTTIATILIPEMSYLTTLTLISGSLAFLLALVVQNRKGSWLVSGLGFLGCAILATFLWIPIIITAYQSLGLTMIWLVIGMAALWISALLPILDWITLPRRWLYPVIALLVGMGFLLTAHLQVGRHSPPPLVNSIGYWLDADQRQAYWLAFISGYRTDTRTTTRTQVAFPQEMDKRQNQLLVNPVRRPYIELFPEAPPFSILTSEAPLLALEGPRLEVLEDDWLTDRRVVKVEITTSMHDRTYIIIPQGNPLLAITLPNNKRTDLSPVDDRGWWLRFDGTPLEGIEIIFEFADPGQVPFLLVEEKTGLPSFPGLSTQPAPGTMPSPGEFYQGVPTDFTALYRRIEVPAFSKARSEAPDFP